jgi:ferritin-like metal-binding protein YciE
MAKKMEGMQQLLVEELQDLYDAEKQLVRALPKMAKSASNEELENAFRQHLEVTRGQVQRLEQIFESMDMRAKSKPCHGMKGLVEEAQEMIEDQEDMVLDAGLIGCGRKVEHYEMAGYESARGLAQQLGMREAAQLLQETLREEMQTDKQLAQLSKRLMKENATMMKAQARSRSAAASRSGEAQPLTDHDEIRQWAEARGGKPTCVRGTGKKGDTGVLRLDFPGYTGAQTLQPISWDDWFEKFDERGLALLVQDKTSAGKKSSFNKLVSRETARQSRRPKARAAR